MHRVIISAPFGNYVRPAGATPTLGTFTLERRRGRLWRVVKTVRRYRRLGAWVNRIGLRNPGIEWLGARVERGREDLSDKVVSIHGFDEREWGALIERAAALRPMAIELNMSCPNVGAVSAHAGVFGAARAVESEATRIIVKLPPVRFEAMARGALDAGLGAFHCCNTLPVPGGGMSGKPLMPMSLRCVEVVRAMAESGGGGDRIVLIGGGGITEPDDVDRYADAGATHVAIGTRVFHPRYLWTHAPIRPLIEQGERALAGRAELGSPRVAS